MKSLLAFSLFFLGGCCDTASEKRRPEQPVTAPPATPAPANPKHEAKKHETFADAMSAFKPLMRDTRGDIDPGSALLAVWFSESGDWSDIQAQKETSIASVKKDIETERGKRICVAGTVVEIAADRSVKPPLFQGHMMNDAAQAITFIAAKSTGSIVENSSARLCGIVTSLDDYPNAIGGTTRSIRVVGMFDLPENKKPVSVPASSGGSKGAAALKTKPGNTADAAALKPCCAALRDTSAPPPFAKRYADAANACWSGARDTESGESDKSRTMANIRGTLSGSALPDACK